MSTATLPDTALPDTETKPRKGGRKPTPEQKNVLHAFRTGGSLRVTALAGSGKTTTLEYLTLKTPGKKFLYIAFNKSVQLEASEKFPSNVECRTAHSLAFKPFGARLRDKIFSKGPRISAAQSAAIIGQRGSFVIPARDPKNDSATVMSRHDMYSIARETVTNFIRSSDDQICDRHFAEPKGLDGTDAALKAFQTRIMELAENIWDDWIDPAGRLRCAQDVYLKLWAMSRPDLSEYDVILVDEAQDTDPLLAQVIANQVGPQIVVVGDENQSIYGWRGATRFISEFNADNSVSLTHSFRFGQRIADEANIWLDLLQSPEHVVGNPNKASVAAPLAHPDAILCRTNGGAIAAAIHTIKSGRTVSLVGGVDDLLRFVRGARELQSTNTTTHSDMRAFESWDDFKDYVYNDEGTDLAAWVRIIDEHGCAMLLSYISEIRDEANQQADVVVSTAHKAKGRQWPKVRIWGDFPQPVKEESGMRYKPMGREEKMLAYVAVTRAEEILDNTGLDWVHDFVPGVI